MMMAPAGRTPKNLREAKPKREDFGVRAFPLSETSFVGRIVA
jgi:hypothetical protein